MIVKFLGTGTSGGVPMIGCKCDVCHSNDPHNKRFRSSVWIQVNNVSLIIDTGPDFRSQALINNIENVDAVLITHFHRDHVAGLDDIKPFCYKNKKPMPIFANDLTVEIIRNEFSYAFSDLKYEGIPEFITEEIDEHEFYFNNILIQPIPVFHYKLPVFGFRIGNFSYITDAKTIPTESYSLLKDLDVLVINALRRTDHFSHFSLAEALTEIEKINPKKAFLTHIGHQLGKHVDVEQELPKNVHLAYDGLTIEL